MSNQSTVWLEEKSLRDPSCEGSSLQGWGETDTNSLALKHVNSTDELLSCLDLYYSVSKVFRPMQNSILGSATQNAKLNFQFKPYMFRLQKCYLIGLINTYGVGRNS